MVESSREPAVEAAWLSRTREISVCAVNVVSILSCVLSHDSMSKLGSSGARLAFAVYVSVIAVIFSVSVAKLPAGWRCGR